MTNKQTCTCYFPAPSLEALTDPNHRVLRARSWLRKCGSIPLIYEGVLDELYVHHTGTLGHYDGESVVDLWSYGPDGLDFVDHAFGDAYSKLKRYCEAARETPSQRLRPEHYNLALLITHSLSIRACRTGGYCSNRGDAMPVAKA